MLAFSCLTVGGVRYTRDSCFMRGTPESNGSAEYQSWRESNIAKRPQE